MISETKLQELRMCLVRSKATVDRGIKESRAFASSYDKASDSFDAMAAETKDRQVRELATVGSVACQLAHVVLTLEDGKLAIDKFVEANGGTGASAYEDLVELLSLWPAIDVMTRAEILTLARN